MMFSSNFNTICFIKIISKEFNDPVCWMKLSVFQNVVCSLKIAGNGSETFTKLLNYFEVFSFLFFFFVLFFAV